MTWTVTPAETRRWLTAPRAGRGIHFATDSGGWGYYEYAELSLAARRSGAAMLAAGARPGDVVCLLMPTGYATLSAYFGAWAAGLTPCMITPPSFTSAADYVELIAGILRQARPALLVTTERYGEVADQAFAAAGLPCRTALHREAAEPVDVAPVQPDDLAILQFTSGSTGVPRGVPVTWRNLAANISCSRAWCSWADDDAVASWLPLYHDMGLIGTLLVAVCGQVDLWLMQPTQFLRDPGRWLECMTRATITAAPPFAYEYAARRVSTDRIAGWDLSRWHTAFVGAQNIDPAVIDRFAEATAVAGFDRTALRPAYGMAEATLGVTGTEPGTAPLVIKAAAGSLRFGGKVDVTHRFRLGDRPVPGRSGWLTGCGSSLAGTLVTIVGEDDIELPANHLGEIVVTGDTVAAGYVGDPGGSGTRFAGGRLYTGDAGFLYDGQLFVLGRMGDSVKVNGRHVYVEDLESAVVEATGLAPERCLAVSVPEPDRAGVVLAVEDRRGGWEEAAYQVLRSRLGPEPRVRLLLGNRGLIRRTTSGKPRRRWLWQQMQNGLPGYPVIEPGTPEEEQGRA